MSDPQQKAYDYLASRFPKRYQVKGTQYLAGLLQALATGDSFISTQVEAVRDNLIAVTATGKYLDQRAGLYGVTRGQGTGVLDPDFEKIIPMMGMTTKQITHTLLGLIDVIYGPYASHANTTAEAFEPYDIRPGWDLVVRVDDTQFTVVFESTDAAVLNAATADEIGRAISEKTGGRIIGSTVSDALTGNKFVNLRSSTIGSQGFIQVLGGNAQSALRFPEVRPVGGTTATYSVTRYQGTDEMIYTVTAGAAMNLKAAGVQSGDLVTVREDSTFNIKNTGTFPVTFVGDVYFRVSNPHGIPESGITNLHTDDFSFFRPDLGNVLLSARPAAIIETSPRQLTVMLPVTSPVVKRTLKGGAHFHQGLTTINSSTGNILSLANTAGFVAPGAFVPTGARNLSTGIVGSVSTNTLTLLNAAGWPTQGAVYCGVTQAWYYYQGVVGNTLQNVMPTPPSSIVGADAQYANRYMFTGVSGNTLTGVFPDPSVLGNAEIVMAGANLVTGFPGSFMYDPTAKFTCSNVASTIAERIQQGDNKTLLQVTDVSAFPDSGTFVLEFGSGKQEGPIKFLTKVGTEALIIDPGHVFQFEHLSGARIRVVRSIGPYTPRKDGSDFAVYHTSTSPARDLLAQYLKMIAASGVSFRFIIQEPSYKWPVLPNLFATNPLSTTLI